ncbi:MAG TPA: extracellular solute-binding protein [Rhabdochlamydiaceae bacterium]|nr:extracellular solute-binding protein [Rhabdochlamydiaceae bacterium]
MIKKVLNRSAVVLFWIALILGILYWPATSFFSREKRSINVFAWGDILEPSVVADFEKETGIKVNLNFYASNEEMIIKLKATEGKGYDLIIPSDYSVEILAKEGLLKELDKSKMNFYSTLNPKLLNHFYDPGNRYSIPFEWELFVLGIDKDYYQTHTLDPSWKILFDKNILDYQVTMTNDPIQTILVASFYLHGTADKMTPEMLDATTKLLIEQKKWVNAYADFRADYFLATKNSVVVLASTSYIWRTMRKFPFVSYVIPKEGTFITIENLCIPIASTKEDLTYQLINYLYSKDSMKRHYDEYGIFPATIDFLDEIELHGDDRSLILMNRPELKSVNFVLMVASQEEFRDAWVRVKTESK